MTGAPKPETESARCFAAWLAALFLVVLGAKLWLIRVYGSAVPFWDQWDEAANVFKPWLEGHLAWGDLFAPHNEHRIFFTRVLDLFEIWSNGQWDPLLQMVVAAFIHTGYACGLAYCLWLLTGRKHDALLCLLLAPFFALPFAAENTLHGFQSQMYFLSIFSLITIMGLGLEKPGSARWFCGLVAAVLALFTMGSGLLASLAVIGLMVLRTLKEKRLSRNTLIIAGCGMAVFTLGLALNVRSEEDKQYQAHEPLVFIDSLMRNLAWPFRDQPVLLFLICLPLVITFVRYLQGRLTNVPAAEFVLTFGFWGLLQAAGLAFARSRSGDSSRYMDALCTIPIASLASWFVLAADIDFRPWSRRVMLMVWVGIVFCGLLENTEKAFTGYLPGSRKWDVVEKQNVQAFVSSDNPACFANQPLMAIPYPKADRLEALLRDPTLQTILPPSCRPPLKAGEIGKVGWLSNCASKLLNLSVVIFGVGLGLLVLLTGCALFRRSKKQACVG